MEFKVRLSNVFIMNIFMIVLAIIMAIVCYFSKFPNKFFNYSYILWLFIAYSRLRAYGRYFYLFATGRSALFVNSNYIEDLTKGVKYYWNDILEINEENAYLYISLNDPKEYLKQIKWTSRNFIKEIISNAYDTPFIINADVLNVNLNALLLINNNYGAEKSIEEKNS